MWPSISWAVNSAILQGLTELSWYTKKVSQTAKDYRKVIRFPHISPSPTNWVPFLEDTYPSHASQSKVTLCSCIPRVVTVSFAFIRDVCAQVPVRLQAPWGLCAASHISSCLESGTLTKYWNTRWMTFSYYVINSSQDKGQGRKKGWSTEVKCSATATLPHGLWNHCPL